MVAMHESCGRLGWHVCKIQYWGPCPPAGLGCGGRVWGCPDSCCHQLGQCPPWLSCTSRGHAAATKNGPAPCWLGVGGVVRTGRNTHPRATPPNHGSFPPLAHVALPPLPHPSYPCTIRFLSSRAIHWYRPQVQQPPDGHTSLRKVQGGLLLSLLPPPFPSFFLSFPLLSSSFLLLPPTSSPYHPRTHSHATMNVNGAPAGHTPAPTLGR